MELLGRRREREVLDRLVQAVRDGESRALIIGGEPGMGKTALLDHVADHATGCHVVRAAGVQSEMELAFAGLHHLAGAARSSATRRGRRRIPLAASSHSSPRLAGSTVHRPMRLGCRGRGYSRPQDERPPMTFGSLR